MTCVLKFIIKVQAMDDAVVPPLTDHRNRMSTLRLCRYFLWQLALNVVDYDRKRFS